MSGTIRRLLILVCGAAAIGLAGCAATEHIGVTPAQGLLFTHYRAPMFCRPDASGAVPCGEDLKQGAVSARAFTLPIPETFNVFSVGWGDAALATAARDAGIHTIYYADYEWLEVLGIYKHATVYVYGE